MEVATKVIKENEKFCFRLHKRGMHWLEEDTPKLERDIGGSIWEALQQKLGKKPVVNLDDPDITVTAEVLGPNTAIGISSKAWGAGQAQHILVWVRASDTSGYVVRSDGAEISLSSLDCDKRGRNH